MTFAGASYGAGRRRHSLFCLCADDFGLSEAVSRGILEVLAAGRLSAISVITTRPNWRAAARELGPFEKQIDLGLHLNLTLAAPLTEMATLAPNGCLPKFDELATAAEDADLPHAEIAREIAAQLYAFAVAFGRFPDFIDGHQHVHLLPGIRRALFQVLHDKGLIGQLWLRNSGDTLWRIYRRRIEIQKALALRLLAQPFVAEANAYGYPVNDGFSGFSSFAETRDYAADFSRYLVALGPAHLVMCHPGYVDDELARLDPVTHAREKERAFLLSPQFRDCLFKHDVELGRLAQRPDRSVTAAA